jgi:hypothetical protein
MSTDMNITRPSSRVLRAPGGELYVNPMLPLSNVNC